MGGHTEGGILASTQPVNASEPKTPPLPSLHTQLTVKLWLFQHFDFSDEDIMEGVYGLAAFLYVFADAVWNPAVQMIEEGRRGRRGRECVRGQKANHAKYSQLADNLLQVAL